MIYVPVRMIENDGRGPPFLSAWVTDINRQVEAMAEECRALCAFCRSPASEIPLVLSSGDTALCHS